MPHAMRLLMACALGAALAPPRAVREPPRTASPPEEALDRRVLLRDMLAKAAAGAGAAQLAPGAAAAAAVAADASGPADESYLLWPLLPLAPYGRKRTIVDELIPGRMWAFEQKLGTLYVHVPVRMTVIKLDGDASRGEPPGLFVYNPVAPTRACVRAMRRLEAEHGPVRHVVLGTLGLEHKVYFGPFAQRFAATARAWYTPGQYSFPVKGLPETLLGFPRGAAPVPADGGLAARTAPWSAELEHATLGPFFSRDGGFGETAFHHRASGTTLVTDTLVAVRDWPWRGNAILEDDPRPLLYHARDDARERVEDTPQARAKGWRHVALFGLLFQPSPIDVVERPADFLADARATRNPELGWNGLYPFVWARDDAPSFAALRGTRGKGLLVAPILQTLLLNREPDACLAWAERVGAWPTKRLAPCHLANWIETDGAEIKSAFAFLRTGVVPDGQAAPLAADLTVLEDADAALVKSGDIKPRAPRLQTTPTNNWVLGGAAATARANAAAKRQLASEGAGARRDARAAGRAAAVAAVRSGKASFVSGLVNA